jgi:hypothetical protein
MGARKEAGEAYGQAIRRGLTPEQRDLAVQRILALAAMPAIPAGAQPVQ